MALHELIVKDQQEAHRELRVTLQAIDQRLHRLEATA